jgi:hypothetical protein
MRRRLPTKGGETMGGSLRSGELSSAWRSTEMISDGCPDTNCKVLLKCIGENLLPLAQRW